MMTKPFKPMLSGKVDDPATEIQFPCYVSGKLDGVRVLKINGQIVTRTLTLVGNDYAREWLGRVLPEGADGELILKSNNFNDSSGAVRRKTGKPDFLFFWFDWYRPGENFLARQEAMRAYHAAMEDNKDIVFWESIPCRNLDAFYKLEQSMLDKGLEGIMIRNDGPYKFGRATVPQGYLLKFKRFDDGEGEVIGFTEAMANQNEKTMDALGRTKRSGHMENKTAKGMLGSFLVRDLATGQEFGVGTGFTHAFAREVWANQDAWLGKIIRYKWQKSGAKDKPRFPSFDGERLREDL
jgi:DNA ligase-1